MFLWVKLYADFESEIKKGVNGGQGSKNCAKMGI